jgi:enoyl-CoA hydratase/carnithine racemase
MLKPLFEWKEGRSYLCLDGVDYRGVKGAILCYYNPPVHQVGNPGLDAYLEALRILSNPPTGFSFLILYGASDPVHAGGDLKESLTMLGKTLEERKKLEAQKALPEEIDRLYDWGDRRIKKGFALYQAVRGLSGQMRVVGICGGGTRFGGSAEIPLMADVLVGDSRSGICFSEAMIGLIPGWSGVGRAITKAGFLNARYMATTAMELKAPQLLTIGIYNCVVEVPFPFPRKEKTSDPAGDEQRYAEALQKNNDDSGLMLLPTGLDLAICRKEEIPAISQGQRESLTTEEKLSAEAKRRSDPVTYEGLWGKSLRDAKDQIDRLGRPLAPQSIEALEKLFAGVSPSTFIEEQFVEAEMNADARLYRDPRFQEGILATLEQKVADFREGKPS